MPVVHDGGAAPPPPASHPIVVVDPDGDGTQTVVEQQPASVEEAVQAASATVKQITVGQPSVGSLPRNARPGEFYSFASNPSVVYFLGSDNIWRALVAVPVT